MVSIEQLKVGLANYLDNELIPTICANENEKILAGVVAGIALKRLDKIVLKYTENPAVKMSDLNAVYTKFPQVLINLAANKEQKQAYKEDEYIAGFIESQQQSLMGMGRVLVRVSGTEPKIRVMVEGQDQNAIQTSAERIADMIRQRILSK